MMFLPMLLTVFSLVDFRAKTAPSHIWSSFALTVLVYCVFMIWTVTAVNAVILIIVACPYFNAYAFAE
jgi:hypothetical protein